MHLSVVCSAVHEHVEPLAALRFRVCFSSREYLQSFAFLEVTHFVRAEFGAVSPSPLCWVRPSGWIAELLAQS